jgi:hypothetical protein
MQNLREDAVRCLHGLPTGVGSGVLDAELLLEMVLIQRVNALDIIEKNGLVGKVPADYAIAIWLYTLEHPSIYKAINAAMFDKHRRDTAGGISAHLRQAMPFIRYLNHALRSLPEEFHFKGRCFRGIRYVFPSPDEHDVVKNFVGKKTVYFYEFKSATQDKRLMFEERYCGRRGYVCLSVCIHGICVCVCVCVCMGDTGIPVDLNMQRVHGKYVCMSV